MTANPIKSDLEMVEELERATFMVGGLTLAVNTLEDISTRDALLAGLVNVEERLKRLNGDLRLRMQEKRRSLEKSTR